MTARRALTLLLATLFAGILLVACTLAPAPVAGSLTRIDVGPASAFVLTPGGTVQLEATFAGTGSIPSSVTWTSSDVSVATVSNEGFVEALASGSVVIRARSVADPAIERSVTLTVTAPLPSSGTLGLEAAGDATILVDGESVEVIPEVREGTRLLLELEGIRLTLQARDRRGATVPVVGSALLLRGTTEGTLDLAGNGFAPGSLVGVFLGEDADPIGTLLVGPGGSYAGSIQLPTGRPAGDVTLFVTGQRDVSEEALRVAQIDGPAVVAVRMRIEDDATPTIVALELDRTGLTLTPGGSAQLGATVVATGGASDEVTWSTGNPTIATVDDSGVVTAVAAGTTSVTAASAADPSMRATAEVVVETDGGPRLDADMTITPPVVQRGEEATIEVVIADGNGKPLDVEASSLEISTTPLGTLGTIVREAAGTYVTTFTAGEDLGSATLVAFLDGAPLGAYADVRVAPPLFRLSSDGVTVECPDAAVGATGEVNGVTYTKRSRSDDTLVASIDTLLAEESTWDLLPTTCTSGIEDFSSMFLFKATFNEDISSWDLSSATTTNSMFQEAAGFNQDLTAWDVGNVKDAASMFNGARQFNNGCDAGVATCDLNDWDTSSFETTERLFGGAMKFNQSVSSWETTNVSTMASMFEGASAFNQDLSMWTVDSVTSMRNMFRYASAFNNGCEEDATTCPLNDWNVANVTVFEEMFLGASDFNQSISDWSVERAQTVKGMFQSTDRFNQDLSAWQLVSATDLSYMFDAAKKFNNGCASGVSTCPLSWTLGSAELLSYTLSGPNEFTQAIDSWDVSTVTHMDLMFEGNTKFDQPLGSWDVRNVTNMFGMFKGSAFTQDISGWCVSHVDQEPVNFDASTNSALWTDAEKPKWGTTVASCDE